MPKKNSLFISVEKISASKVSTTKPKSMESLVQTVNAIIKDKSDEDDFADFASVMQKLYIKMKDFNPKNYGATNQKPILFFQKELQAFFELKKVGNIYNIKIKQKL